MSGVRTLGCQGKRGERENMNEEHIRLSPWPALTDLAAWLHRTRVASSRGQTETGRKRSSMASKSGDGTRDTGKSGVLGVFRGSSSSSNPWHSRVGRFGQVPPTGIPGIPASSRGPSHPKAPLPPINSRQDKNPRFRCRGFHFMWATHHRSRFRCNAEARRGDIAFSWETTWLLDP